jgi:hypothetical protein
MGLLIARWGRFRIPVALALIDPKIKGHQNILFRQMLQDFVSPTWVRQIVVVADAGFAANATLRLIMEKPYTYVFAMPRTRKFTNGKHLSVPWGNTSRSAVTTAAPVTNLMGAAVTTESLPAARRSIIWAMSRLSCPKNGVTMGRRA